jgi:hypothetical protein
VCEAGIKPRFSPQKRKKANVCFSPKRSFDRSEIGENECSLSARSGRLFPFQMQSVEQIGIAARMNEKHVFILVKLLIRRILN